MDHNPPPAPIESPTPPEREGQQSQHWWVFFAALFFCILCAAVTAVWPRQEPIGRLMAINALLFGALAFGFLLRRFEMRRGARKFDNRRLDKPPGDLAPAPDPVPARTALPLWAFTIRYWRRLFASRKRLIVEAYLGDGVLLGADSDWNAIIESGRARLRDQLERNGVQLSSPADLDQLESQMASAARMVAGWMTFWTAALPAASLAAIICWRGLTAAWAVAFSLVLFPLLAILGLFLQIPLVPVFARLMNRARTPRGCRLG